MDQKNLTANTTEPVSEKRRKLLKAALTTAPVVATLGSGSVLANASAFQCVSENRRRYNHTFTPYEKYAAKNPDKLVRVAVPKYRFTRNNRTKSRYILPAPYTDTLHYKYDNDHKILYEATLGPQWSRGDVIEGKDRWALVYWDMDANDTATTGTSQVDVRTDNTNDLGPKTLVAGTGSPTPLDGSCMCSVDPNFQG